MQTIDLDCAPGGIRPGDLIIAVVKGSPLEGLATSDNAVDRLFGNWTWQFDISDEVWERDVQPVIIPRITDLYGAGVIRYGSCVIMPIWLLPLFAPLGLLVVAVVALVVQLITFHLKVILVGLGALGAIFMIIRIVSLVVYGGVAS